MLLVDHVLVKQPLQEYATNTDERPASQRTTGGDHWTIASIDRRETTSGRKPPSQMPLLRAATAIGDDNSANLPIHLDIVLNREVRERLLSS
jgi:hypothetical protein